jgi:hypothetical protein
MAKGRVRAVVQVVLDVEAGDVWSTDTSWDQIAKQAEDSVRGLFTHGNELAMKDIPRRIKKLRVTEVLVKREEES